MDARHGPLALTIRNEKDRETVLELMARTIFVEITNQFPAGDSPFHPAYEYEADTVWRPIVYEMLLELDKAGFVIRDECWAPEALEMRDKFLGGRGLWSEFVEWAEANPPAA